MAKNDYNKCEDCQFWDDREFSVQEGRVQVGYCRCHSPRLRELTEEEEAEEELEGPLAQWPVTRCWDWCGEFVPQENPKRKPGPPKGVGPRYSRQDREKWFAAHPELHGLSHKEIIEKMKNAGMLAKSTGRQDIAPFEIKK